MRVWVDRDACQGHSRCYALVPELFDVDIEGFAHVVTDGDVPVELEARAALAAANCPEHAIRLDTR